MRKNLPLLGIAVPALFIGLKDLYQATGIRLFDILLAHG